MEGYFDIDIEREDLPTPVWKLVHFAAGHMHITAVTTTLPLLIGAAESNLKATVVVAQHFCSLLVCGSGREKNEFFVAAFAASF